MRVLQVSIFQGKTALQYSRTRETPVLVLIGSAGHMPDDHASRFAYLTEAGPYLSVVAFSHRGCSVPLPGTWAIPFLIIQRRDFQSKWNRTRRKLSAHHQVSLVMLFNYWLSIQLTKHWVHRIALQSWFENSECSWFAVSGRLYDFRQNWAKDLSLNQSQSIIFQSCIDKINSRIFDKKLCISQLLHWFIS